ncbi:MAG: hypothetical protein JSS27_17725 [Planctomycetes bacterium]|nr:hypothetical protein [Planctomycetota bacterium]
MSEQPRFRHQRYTRQPDTSRAEFLRAEPCPPLDSAEFRQQLAQVGRQLVAADVDRVMLIHGTFGGNDGAGLAAALRRASPRAADGLEWVIKSVIDLVLGDRGNYPPRSAPELQAWLSAETSRSVAVERFIWNSENHHLGRADGAVRLIDYLARQPTVYGARRLLLGHSHGGNLLALVTQLLAASTDKVDSFFQAAERYWRPASGGHDHFPHWAQVREWLLAGHGPELARTLDVVSLGAPVRYGWDLAGCGRLLHLMSHRPREGAKNRYCAAFPLTVTEWLRGSQGDVIAQVGIAGTNFAPIPLLRRAWHADHRLADVLQGTVEPQGQWERWKTGPRVHDTGPTLLVDFGVQSWLVLAHAAGHGLYTRAIWAPFIFRTIVERLYGNGAAEQRATGTAAPGVSVYK